MFEMEIDCAKDYRAIMEDTFCYSFRRINLKKLLVECIDVYYM